MRNKVKEYNGAIYLTFLVALITGNICNLLSMKNDDSRFAVAAIIMLGIAVLISGFMTIFWLIEWRRDVR